MEWINEHKQVDNLDVFSKCQEIVLSGCYLQGARCTFPPKCCFSLSLVLHWDPTCRQILSFRGTSFERWVSEHNFLRWRNLKGIAVANTQKYIYVIRYLHAEVCKRKWKVSKWYAVQWFSTGGGSVLPPVDDICWCLETCLVVITGGGRAGAEWTATGI